MVGDFILPCQIYHRIIKQQFGVNFPTHIDIDYECMGRDNELNGEMFTAETAYNEVHVFRLLSFSPSHCSLVTGEFGAFFMISVVAFSN